MVTLRNAIDNPQDPKHPYEVLGAAVGNLRGPTMERVYIGPKELSSLESVSIPGIAGANPDLRGLVDFGWLGIIARPLFLWLKWTYNHIVPNWGWAIVLQTLIISVAMLPLRISQMKSMLKMQRVAPQIKSIQEKYKKYSLRDPRKAPMNEEISALYKKEGVNPAGGCLPLIIQMPFLFAYYRMLGTALDLRHAHWLWIHDLSAAHRSRHQHVGHAKDDSPSRHGPSAAENDDVDDAPDDGIHLLQTGSRTKPVLRREQSYFDRAAGRYESNPARPRNARDDGETCPQEGEVKLLAASF